MLVKYVKDNYYSRFHYPNGHKNRETKFSILLHIKFGQSHWSVKYRGKKRCMLVEYVKDNYYARFHNPSYHKDRETH